MVNFPARVNRNRSFNRVSQRRSQHTRSREGPALERVALEFNKKNWSFFANLLVNSFADHFGGLRQFGVRRQVVERVKNVDSRKRTFHEFVRAFFRVRRDLASFVAERFQILVDSEIFSGQLFQIVERRIAMAQDESCDVVDARPRFRIVADHFWNEIYQIVLLRDFSSAS